VTSREAIQPRHDLITGMERREIPRVLFGTVLAKKRGGAKASSRPEASLRVSCREQLQPRSNFRSRGDRGTAGLNRITPDWSEQKERWPVVLSRLMASTSKPLYTPPTRRVAADENVYPLFIPLLKTGSIKHALVATAVQERLIPKFGNVNA